ncbi:hypothetical protein BDQ17DRAFT_1426543 [Cyathus striatus]|nr:hypothetical protein BDQ17DRAFT_1426543 [Cyathus striatus]
MRGTFIFAFIFLSSFQSAVYGRPLVHVKPDNSGIVKAGQTLQDKLATDVTVSEPDPTHGRKSSPAEVPDRDWYADSSGKIAAVKDLKDQRIYARVNNPYLNPQAAKKSSDVLGNSLTLEYASPPNQVPPNQPVQNPHQIQQPQHVQQPPVHASHSHNSHSGHNSAPRKKSLWGKIKSMAKSVFKKQGGT